MADINVTVPNSTFSVTKPNSSFTVTTPTEQTIAVGNPASTINITNTPIAVDVHTNGLIQINSDLNSTDDLNEGTINLYFTNTRARQAIQVSDTGGDGSLSYDNSTGVITYTGPSASEVRSHFSAGTGITITNGSIAIGQSVGIADQVQFAAINIDGLVVLDTASLTTTTTAANQILDTWNASTYRSAKYQIQITSGSSYQMVDIAVIHDGTTAIWVIYADIKTGATDLASFSVDINSGSVRLLTTPANATTAFKAVRTTTTT